MSLISAVFISLDSTFKQTLSQLYTQRFLFRVVPLLNLNLAQYRQVKCQNHHPRTVFPLRNRYILHQHAVSLCKLQFPYCLQLISRQDFVFPCLRLVLKLNCYIQVPYMQGLIQNDILFCIHLLTPLSLELLNIAFVQYT
jgi:hypothetical protein